jgi:hypothetical protein
MVMRYVLLKGPTAREKSGREGSPGNWVNSCRSARTGHKGEVGEAASWIAIPLRKGSAFDAGRLRVTELVPNVTCFRAKLNVDEVDDQLSHVNSPDRRNAANATRIAALRLTPSKLFVIPLMIRERIGAVRGRRSRFVLSP